MSGNRGCAQDVLTAATLQLFAEIRTHEIFLVFAGTKSLSTAAVVSYRTMLATPPQGVCILLRSYLLQEKYR